MIEEIIAYASPASVVPMNLSSIQTTVLDLTESNPEAHDSSSLGSYIERATSQYTAAAIGRYNEDRVIYRRSKLFGSEEPRSIHLGIDIWAPCATPVLAAYSGRVHSFQDNSAYGDYGPTIIIEHRCGELPWYTLYGHLSRHSLKGLYQGKPVKTAQPIGEIGGEQENGGWPAHLHFQVILDMEGRSGDYPGVCTPGQRDYYLKNCPDPQLLLHIKSLNQV